MIDYEAPSSRRAIEALQVGDTRKNLLKFGALQTGSDAGGEDLLVDALSCVCNPQGRPWDPARASFATHMRIVMRDLARQERRSWRARHEVLSSKKVAKARSRAPLADDALADAKGLDRLRRKAETLRARLAERPRALQVFDARMQGIERAEGVARFCGCSVEEVYEANRRIAYHAAKVLEEERAAEDAEMKERQERARKSKPS